MSRPLSTEARQKAIDATLEIVFSRGIDGFTVNEVAARSGVAKTTIYRHWPEPKVLLVEALQGCITAMPTPNTGSLHEDLTVFIAGALPVATQPGMRSVVLNLMAGAENDPDLVALHERMKDERDNPIRTMVQLAVARGELPEGIPLELAVAFIEGPLFQRIMIEGEPLTDDEVRQLVAWTVAGLRGATIVTAELGNQRRSG